MVKSFISILLMFIALSVQAASAYKLEPSTVALGEPVTLTLTARPGTLDKLDLKSIAMDFEIHGRTLGSDGREENLVLVLYPMHTGRIALPDLGLRGRSPVVMVNEESENTPKVRFRFETNPEKYHVRQPIRLTIEACDDGSLMWQRPQLATREGLFIRALNEEFLEVEREGERCTAHRWHWSVLPTAVGMTSLPLPMLEANKFGQRLRFPPPPVVLEALPVPAWLPAEVAIGRPEVSVSSLPKQWPLNRPMAWRIEVSGGYSAEALKNLLRVQLASQPQFSDYSPNVEELKDDNGVPLHAVSVYPMFRERGELKLPDLVFPWYEPVTGKLQQLHIPGTQLFVVDPARQRLVNFLLAVAPLVVLSIVAYLLWRMFGWRLHRHRALVGLKQVEDIDSLALHLCAFSLRAEKKPAATLGEWRERMLQEVQMDGLEELVRDVEQSLYGTERLELSYLVRQARECLAKARPV